MQFSTQSRIAILLYSLFVTITLSPIPVYAADVTGYTFLTSASEVRLAFAASDRQGRAIKTLRSSDVAVADNGSIIRKFRSFRPASESPPDVVILLDVSESVESRMPAEIAEIKSFVEELTGGSWHDLPLCVAALRACNVSTDSRITSTIYYHLRSASGH